MKKILIALASIAALSFIASCTKEEANSVEEQGKQITITASIPEGGLTKVGFTTNGDDLKLAWEVGDQITVSIPNVEPIVSQVFTLTGGAGTKSGTFSGTALPAATKYRISYDGGATYATQTQADTDNTEHLKYAAILNGVSTYSNFTFSQSWATANGGTFTQSSVLRIKAILPGVLDSAVEKVVVKSDANIFAGGNQIVIDLASAPMLGSDNDIIVYASLPGEQVIPAGTKLWIIFQTSDSNAYEKYTAYRELPAMTILAGKVNTIKLNCENIDKYAGKDDDGTAAHPYLIADQNQMKAIALTATKQYYKLIDDIDMTGVDWSSLNPTLPYEQYIDLDGNNKVISNLSSSLFYVFKGSAKNFTLEGSTINSGNQRGVFAQYIQGTNHYVTNVDIRNVSTFNAGSKNCGGLIGCINSGTTGQTSATIEDCDLTNVPVNSTGSAGGLIGMVDSDAKVIVNNCTCTGNAVSTNNHYAAGLIARADGEVIVSHCYTDMSVTATGKYRAGGIIGWAVKGSVSQCSAKGNITSAQYSGGLIGTVKNAAGDSFEVSESCYTTGTLSPTGNLNGGLIGSKEGDGSLSISNCYSTGSVIAETKQRVGGILANHFAGTTTIENCYFAGTLRAAACIGGIVGWVESDGLSVTNCMSVPTELHAVQNVADAERYCSGLVIGYANNSKTPKMIVDNCYRTPASNFMDYEGVKTINVVEDHAFITGTPAAIPQRNGLSYGFYHHGQNKDAATLSALVQRSDIGGAWSSTIWDFTQDMPRLKWMLE